MECPKCQTDVSPDASACAACGAPLAESAPPEAEKKRPRRLVIVLVALGVVVLIGAGIAAVLASRNAHEDAPPADGPSHAESDRGAIETSGTGDVDATGPKTETPGSDGTSEEPAEEAPPAQLGYATAEEAARAALEANGNGEYILAPAREDDELAVYWAGPPRSEWVYEIIVQRGSDGSWSVVSMTNIWEDYEVP